jgi:MYXO-CTERM domain-containing protein
MAHIELSDPIARYEITGVDTGMKGCPCGMATGGGNSNRTCNVELDGSDPNRAEARAHTAPAGSTLVLKFNETIGHAGKYRVAFDDDGADFYDFNDHVLTEVDDPQGNTGNAGGTNWEIEVTLPDTPCTNCTLQLTQVMDPSTLGGTVDGSQLASMSTYYVCIDLVLTGDAPSTGETGDDTSGAVSSSDVGTDVSMETSTTTPSDSGTTSSGAAPTTASSNVPPVDQPVNPTPSTTGVAPSPVTPPQPTSTGAAPGVTSPAPVTTPPAASTSMDSGFGEGSAEEPAGGCSVVGAQSPFQGRALWTLVGVGMFFVRRRRRQV